MTTNATWGVGSGVEVKNYNYPQYYGTLNLCMQVVESPSLDIFQDLTSQSPMQSSLSSVLPHFE